MSSAFDIISHKAEYAAAGAIIDGLLKHVNKDREKAFLQAVDMAERFWKKDFPDADFDSIRKIVKDRNNRWIKFINRVLDETDPNVARTTLMNLGYGAFLKGTRMIHRNREKYGCNIPWLILFDPTTACNMHCVGCWSGTYGAKHNLSYEDMDKIVTQGKELGSICI